MVRVAFAPEDVPAFLDALRREHLLIGEWLADDGTGILGHIAFARVHLDDANATRHPAALLTPLAVRPKHQRQGIGGALMARAHADLEAAGERAFLVLGHPDYYKRAGYEREAALGIGGPWSATGAFMARGTVPKPSRLVLPPAIAAAG